MTLYTPDRALLLPTFETYRLKSLDPSSNLLSFPLPPPGATQSRMGYSQQHLSFKEVRSRIGWDHLSVDEGGRRGMWVDGEWGVVGFTLGDDLEPTFTKLADLPQPVSSTTQQSEFPSILPLSQTRWAIATGSGSLYILQTSSAEESSFTGKLVARYDFVLKGSEGQAVPFLLRAQHQVAEDDVRLLVSRSVQPAEDGSGKSSFSSIQSTPFEFLELSLNSTVENGVDDAPGELNVKWALRGKDLPVWCSWYQGADAQGWIVLSEDEFTKAGAVKEETEVERKKRERDEKVSKLGLGATLSAEDRAPIEEEKGDAMDVEEEQGVYPYTWTQTPDTLNITIPVPESISRKDIKLALSRSSFSFSLFTLPADISPQLATFLQKSIRQFWSEIDQEESSWTFESTTHTITLDLQKVDENVRWPSVFSSPIDEDSDEEEDEVPETFSAAHLASVRQSFSSIHTRSPDEPPLPHPAIPALLREEMDFDLEDGEDFEETEGGNGDMGGGGKVGRDVLTGFIRVETGEASWSRGTNSVLSLPLNGSGGEAVIVKQAVDGLVYAPQSEGQPSKKPWAHVSTSPALAFVLSSKRDIRLVRNLSPSPFPSSSSSSSLPVPTTVLAFDSGSSTAGQGNVYTYYPPLDKASAQQGVLSLSGGDRGALLGVGWLKVGGEGVVVGLCEKELVVLRGVV
ncbi:hypothetical protein I350_03790 [Cryptococcus amylolentus CBS 6273]|uniref:NudC domain-containing protein 1 n=1 Tax=Cryptococcus amylolentus CBS 6273 TaxID=1296118 RepID=A0A1E3K571_9TREE|nr:hypothetical protein I350_03790 [Cryptococcus amylolentus CBS 6273]